MSLKRLAVFICVPDEPCGCESSALLVCRQRHFIYGKCPLTPTLCSPGLLTISQLTPSHLARDRPCNSSVRVPKRRTPTWHPSAVVLITRPSVRQSNPRRMFYGLIVCATCASLRHHSSILFFAYDSCNLVGRKSRRAPNGLEVRFLSCSMVGFTTK